MKLYTNVADKVVVKGRKIEAIIRLRVIKQYTTASIH